jgi:mycoredoxin
MSAAPTSPPAGTITMFSTPWCGYCRGLKSALKRENIGYTEVNIERHMDGADFVMSVNGGNQTVPTVVFPDGTCATNPSVAEVRMRLDRSEVPTDSEERDSLDV